MDIMELGAIGELVGGVAVIASLLYVGFQVRQSTSVAKGELAQGVHRLVQPMEPFRGTRPGARASVTRRL